ncbi:uncharacterized mitochondrial protein AtMg00310-like [Coffea arabica]|uniref:Uncharacterized mitochondrial protein AtMg00310-like n=1 Tax=Coffea arabica TaxID=13443 RepID=A0ABM4X4X6_COFAR
MAIPTYAMSCYKLPKKLRKEICSMMARCWWGQNNKKNKQHWIAWEKFTKNKEEDGMGFKDIQMFNKALLAKQVWKIMTQPNLLQSLMSAREVIEDCCKKKIGNGRGTNIWKDKWINNDRGGRIKTQKPKGSDMQKVSQLMVQYRWNRTLIYKVFNKEDA